jgi:hypothetical protein
MTGALDYATLDMLDRSRARPGDVPCPLCSPGCTTKVGANKPVLKIWHERPGFATYRCARCGASGWASDRTTGSIDPAELARRRAASRVASEEHDLAQRAKALWLWDRAEPVHGSIAETYLAGRGIAYRSPTLRFLPPRGDHAPAMLAPFGVPRETDPGVLYVAPTALRGVHLTRLVPDGRGKAPNAEGRSRIMIGPSDGWPIVLAPLGDGGGLAVAEGIETALSAAQEGLGAWAAGSAGRLPKLAARIAPIAAVEAVTILAEDDDAGRRGAEGLAGELARLRPDLEVRTL